jgi:superfamily II DNA or RNA helicase
MQNRPPARPGDVVFARRARWRVVSVRRYDRCHLVTLRGIAAPFAGVQRRVVTPFDLLEPAEPIARPRVVAARLWRRACRALIAADAPAGSLAAAGIAVIDLLPFQLEPALAVVGGAATRLLLADEVGLGKTIQAALVAAELLARGAVERVLVLTPAGLRDQWIDELGRRVHVRAARMDVRTLRHAAASLPVGVNPWAAEHTAVASIDYVKRREVLPAVAAVSWDLIVVDEAHGVAGDSDRRAAAHALAARATYVLLVTATPHSGDRDLFASLCGIGAVDDSPLVVFRRRRADVGFAAARRVHIVRVRPSGAERRMHALLSQYAAAVRAERGRAGQADALLALVVLHKRMLSSAWSLAQSVDRRLGALTSVELEDAAKQLLLPLQDPAGELTSADEPPPWPSMLRLADPSRERRLLTALGAAARAASQAETKLQRLAALLRRTRERAIVFTEYRDTLAHVGRAIARPVFTLHGGLARDERSTALEQFAATPHAVLLATDAAAEGLNLHEHCRIVVNLELPWNPGRLEQRIGRVDRIGQRRTVHAFHLVSAAGGEAIVLERLRARIAVAAADVGMESPLGDARAELELATLIVPGGPHDGTANDRSAGGGDR